MYNSPKQSGIILPSKWYTSPKQSGIILPSKWYTSPKQSGILLPRKWYNSPKQMVYFSQWKTGKMQESWKEPDIENMTLNEYLDYEAEKERRLWDNVQSRRNTTPPNTPVDKKDFDFDKILDYLFRIEAKNMKRMGQDKLQDSIWEHDNDLEEDREDDGDDRDTFDM
ncbi:hypothetical protein Tco_0000938 [Tanacetum coccineum]